MNQNQLSDTYISALLATLNTAEAVAVLTQFNDVIDALLVSRQNWTMLMSPMCGVSEKLQLIEKSMGGSLHPKLQNFFKLLVRKHRLSLLSEFKKPIHRAILAISNKEDATIYTPIELTDPDRDKIISMLEAQSGKSLNPKFQMDESLLGGFKAFVGLSVVDGSHQNTLNRLKETLK